MEAEYTVVVMQRAIADIISIGQFVAVDSSLNASRLVARLERAINAITVLPLAHPVAPESQPNETPIRHCFPAKNYRILFRVRGRLVEVLHVRHASRERKFPSE